MNFVLFDLFFRIKGTEEQKYNFRTYKRTPLNRRGTKLDSFAILQRSPNKTLLRQSCIHKLKGLLDVGD